MHKAGTCSSMENHWKCWNLREVRERKIHHKPTFQGKKHPRSFRRSHCVAELSSFPSLIFSAILRGSPKIVTNVFVGVEKTQLQDVI
jgi:hypothetical protein